MVDALLNLLVRADNGHNIRVAAFDGETDLDLKLLHDLADIVTALSDQTRVQTAVNRQIQFIKVIQILDDFQNVLLGQLSLLFVAY